MTKTDNFLSKNVKKQTFIAKINAIVRISPDSTALSINLIDRHYYEIIKKIEIVNLDKRLTITRYDEIQ